MIKIDPKGALLGLVMLMVVPSFFSIISVISMFMPPCREAECVFRFFLAPPLLMIVFGVFFIVMLIPYLLIRKQISNTWLTYGALILEVLYVYIVLSFFIPKVISFILHTRFYDLYLSSFLNAFVYVFFKSVIPLLGYVIILFIIVYLFVGNDFFIWLFIILGIIVPLIAGLFVYSSLESSFYDKIIMDAKISDNAKYDLIVGSSDSNRCRELTVYENELKCRVYIAAKDGDPKKCASGLIESQEIECYKIVAQKLNNSKICDDLNDGYTASLCNYAVAVQFSQRERCTAVPSSLYNFCNSEIDAQKINSS